MMTAAYCIWREIRVTCVIIHLMYLKGENEIFVSVSCATVEALLINTQTYQGWLIILGIWHFREEVGYGWSLINALTDFIPELYPTWGTDGSGGSSQVRNRSEKNYDRVTQSSCTRTTQLLYTLFLQHETRATLVYFNCGSGPTFHTVGNYGSLPAPTPSSLLR